MDRKPPIDISKLRLSTLFAAAALFASMDAGALKVGDTLPQLADFKLEGKLPDDLKGKVVLLDFWASWCPPCKASFPVMDELQKEYRDRGLVVIAVSEDDRRADMDTFIKKNAATFAVVFDPHQKLRDHANVTTMPTSFLIDRTGHVQFTHAGYNGDETQKQYKDEIETLLKK